jgi:hypothetical protein
VIPIPDQFSWRAKAGEVQETGRGLLSSRLKSAAIDEFLVAVGGLIAAAYPQRGELHLDHQKVYHCPCRKPHKLIWSWRMKIDLSSGQDKNTGPASYMCSVLGLECTENKFAVQFLRDGTVKAGFE